MILTFFSFFLNSESLSEESFLEFNFNLFETNIVNIALLVGLLLYGNKVSFRGNLKQRRDDILQVIEKAQEDLLLTSNYYNSTEDGAKQVQFWLQSWELTYKKEKQEIVKTKSKQVKNGFATTFTTTQLFLKTFENKAFLSLQRYLLFLTASRILRKFLLLSRNEQTKFVDMALTSLGGMKQ